MKTFRINVGQTTAKSKYIKLYEFFVNSENKKEDIITAYNNKYIGFQVYIEEIEEIKIFNEKKQDNIDKKDELIITNVKPLTSRYSKDIQSYDAEIKYNDISELWKEKEKKLEPLKSAIQEVNYEFESNVKNKFNLKDITNFREYRDGVRFSFKPSSFNFNTKEAKQ